MTTLDWAEVGPVTAIVNGVKRSHASLEEAISCHRGRIETIVGAWRDGHVSSDPDYLQIDHFPAPWSAAGPASVRFVDRFGLPVPVWRVAVALQSMPERARQWRRFPHAFRGGPVPHTRCRRGGNGWFRDFSTLPEMTAADGLAHDEDASELGIRVRAKRNPVNLPTSWDDRAPSRLKNWKEQRRTQWR